MALTAAAAAGSASPARAARQQVDVFTARLVLDVHHVAKVHEDGWSRVDTRTELGGTLHGRVDGLVFVDGIPQQRSAEFSAVNATDLRLTQHADYSSPDGNASGDCAPSIAEVKPLGVGTLATELAQGRDGTPQLVVTLHSPDNVWVEKSCSGYLSHEIADPLLLDGIVRVDEVPITAVHDGFTLPVHGVPPCPDWIRVQHCESTYAGTIEFQRTASYVRGEPDPEAPASSGPAPLPADPTDAQIDAFMLGILVRHAREDRYGQAVLRCGQPCTGSVSAYAIALSKQGRQRGPASKLGSTHFTSKGGDVTARVPLSAADRSLARRRGAIEYRAEARPVGGGSRQQARATLRVR